MTRTKLRRESRRMRFEESHGGWEERRLTREEAARLPGACARTFRRYVDRYEEDGLDGLLDRRLSQVSARRPRPMRFRGPRCFTASGMTEGTSCVSTVTIVANMRETELNQGQDRPSACGPGVDGSGTRQASPPPRAIAASGDGSTHEWVPGQYWDLIITLEDLTLEHDSMFFVEEEGTAPSIRAMAEVFAEWGLPSSLYADRGSHCWHTPEAGGKVDRCNLTRFGRAMTSSGWT